MFAKTECGCPSGGGSKTGDIRYTERKKRQNSDINLTHRVALYATVLNVFTWSQRNPFVARRLDYFCTSSDVFDKVLNCDIVSVPFSDHRGCSVQIKVSETVRGNGYWKFDNLLLEDIEYVDEMNNLIESFTGDGVDSQTEWELLKINITEFTCNYSKRKHEERKKKDCESNE